MTPRPLTYLVPVLACMLCTLTTSGKSPSDSLTVFPTVKRSIRFQATYIYQYKPEFGALYSGPNSLVTEEEKQNSLTATLYAGQRLWKGAEIYINPEVAGGSGLSGAFGLGASSNGETFRVGDPAPSLYLARLYFTQLIRIHDSRPIAQPDGPNLLGGEIPAEYLKFFIGKFSLGDLFDNNAYANSPRMQLMNWCLMNNGAYDYAANVRGYTYAFAAVLQTRKTVYRAAVAMLPETANGAELNTNLNEEISFNAEVDQPLVLGKKSGTIRFLAFHNAGYMGRYSDALAVHYIGVRPVVANFRQYGNSKTGISVNADLQVNNSLGLFARAGWNDGKTETWVFTEADRSLSAGLSLSGNKWHRGMDNVFAAMVVNGLSQPHSDYLAAGGLGFQLGDNRLKYGAETALELMYRFAATDNLWLSADYQFILNPGYNADRGPVNVFSFRVHAEL